MTSEHVERMIRESSVPELIERVGIDLDVSSPLIGAAGVPDEPGPEEPYVAAVHATEGEPQAIERFGQAVNNLLMDEAVRLTRTGKIGRPLLIFNLSALLEAVRLPKVHLGLRQLSESVEPLRQALADRGEDLYARLMLAYAVNQERPAQVGPWLELLKGEDLVSINAGIVGLRESSWENACIYLPVVQEVFKQHPELGEFSDEVMLLVDTYPRINWPDCARDHLAAAPSGIWDLVVRHGIDRYRPAPQDLHGPAMEVLKRTNKLPEAVQRRKPMRTVCPAGALTGMRLRASGGVFSVT